MNNTKFLTFACLFLVSFSNMASDAIKLDEKMISAINDHISKATSNCNFAESTKYYSENTKFLNYSIVDSKEVVQEQSYAEAMSEFNTAMKACYVTLAKEKTISEVIEISATGQSAIFKSEAFHYLKSTDGRLFESHNKGKMLFSVVNGKVKIMETHYFALSFREIEKLP